MNNMTLSTNFGYNILYILDISGLYVIILYRVSHERATKVHKKNILLIGSTFDNLNLLLTLNSSSKRIVNWMLINIKNMDTLDKDKRIKYVQYIQFSPVLKITSKRQFKSWSCIKIYFPINSAKLALPFLGEQKSKILTRLADTTEKNLFL